MPANPYLDPAEPTHSQWSPCISLCCDMLAGVLPLHYLLCGAYFTRFSILRKYVRHSANCGLRWFACAGRSHQAGERGICVRRREAGSEAGVRRRSGQTSVWRREAGSGQASRRGLCIRRWQRKASSEAGGEAGVWRHETGHSQACRWHGSRHRGQMPPPLPSTPSCRTQPAQPSARELITRGACDRPSQQLPLVY